MRSTDICRTKNKRTNGASEDLPEIFWTTKQVNEIAHWRTFSGDFLAEQNTGTISGMEDFLDMANEKVRWKRDMEDFRVKRLNYFRGTPNTPPLYCLGV